jgi:hypothetical protein
VKHIMILLCVAAFTASSMSNVVAKSSGWMTAAQLNKFDKEMRKQKKKFSRITCINEFRGSKRKPKILLRVGVRSNRSNRSWGWAVGRSVSNHGIKFERAGMRQLALHTSIEPSGYRFQCAVWG